MNKETKNLIPKFNLGDEVYRLFPISDEISQVIIIGIKISMKDITYFYEYQGIENEVCEKNLNKNKDGLIQQLNKNIVKRAKDKLFFIEGGIKKLENEIKTNKSELQASYEQKKLINQFLNQNDKDL